VRIRRWLGLLAVLGAGACGARSDIFSYDQLLPGASAPGGDASGSSSADAGKAGDASLSEAGTANADSSRGASDAEAPDGMVLGEGGTPGDRAPGDAGDGGSSSDASDARDSSDDVDGAGLPPSCRPTGPGMTDCGEGSESCCTSLEVEGGTFYRTYVNNGGGPTGEADPATVSSFRLDKYEVTVARFREFMRAWAGGAGYLPFAGSGKHSHLNGGLGLVDVGVAAGDAGPVYETGWVPDYGAYIAAAVEPGWGYTTWTASPGPYEKLPINFVTWYAAYAFCIWDGGFLPSEAEWEYAAAGGSLQREYPWGSMDPGTRNEYAIYGGGDVCYYPSGAACTFTPANIAPVGTPTLGAGAWGQLDLAGNLYEWNLDWGASPYVAPCTDCADLSVVPSYATFRVMRGGDFFDFPRVFLPTYRNSDLPEYGDAAIGLRCARGP
jgi:formylglycine-generating enzyme required for sulfatase activity